MLVFIDCESKSVRDTITNKVMSLLADECYKVRELNCHDFSSKLSMEERMEKLNNAMECVRSLISSGERAIYFVPYSLASTARDFITHELKFNDYMTEEQCYNDAMTVFRRNVDKFIHAHNTSALSKYVMNNFNIPTYTISIDCSDLSGNKKDMFFYTKMKLYSMFPKVLRNIFVKVKNATVHDSNISNYIGSDIVYKLTSDKDNHNSIVCSMFLGIKKFFYKNLKVNENIYMKSNNTVKYQLAGEDL